MSDSVIKVENVSKSYRLGQIGGGTLKEDVSRWWAKLRGQPDPTLKIGQEHHARHIREQFWALDNVSFEVKEGEVLGIIGRNGAGKSTLLKILSQVTTPTSGEIKVRGRIASLLEVGTGFHPELTGRENIFLNGAILGMTKAEIRKKFDEIVAFSGIEEFIDTPVKRYSSGMYVRLAFAVAAHLEPEILIVDEVLAVGDAEFQKKCLGKMKDVSGEGRTVLFVSHNMATIQNLCRGAILLKEGSVQAVGTPQAIISEYMSQPTASVLGKIEFDSATAERFGPKEISRLISLCLTDTGGNLLKVVRMAQEVCVRLEIEFKQAGDHFEIGVGVVNIYGVYLHYFVSNWENLEPVDSPGIKTIEVIIPKISLFPGSYFFSVWVKRQGGAYDDAVHEALNFDVEEAPISTGHAYFARYSQNSQVYAPSHWRFVK